jgi:hypothetical protein
MRYAAAFCEGGKEELLLAENFLHFKIVGTLTEEVTKLSQASDVDNSMTNL